MIRRSAKWLALYLAGAAGVLTWSLGHVLGGTVTNDNAAGVIVFPLAWIFGFWPTVTPILLALRVWRLQQTIGDLCAQRAAGLSPDAGVRELEETLTLLVAEENHLPEWLARRLVRRIGLAARSAAAAR